MVLYSAGGCGDRKGEGGGMLEPGFGAGKGGASSLSMKKQGIDNTTSFMDLQVCYFHILLSCSHCSYQ